MNFGTILLISLGVILFVFGIVFAVFAVDRLIQWLVDIFY